MFITIRQTRASGKNLFEVEGETGVLFRARPPWARIRAPLQAENLRQLTFADAAGNAVFHTAYRVLENALASLSRYQYLFGTAAKLAEYQVLDPGGTVLGSFFTQVDGALDTKLVIEHQGRTLLCYGRGLGRFCVFSIYDGTRQIAQITKPLSVRDRLDVYYLHLDDACRAMLPILSFFTIYVDARLFDRPGQAGSSLEIAWSRTFDRNDDKYDPTWVRRTFGQAADDRLRSLLEAPPEGRAPDPAGARRTRRLAIGALAAAAVLIAAAAVAAWLLLRPVQTVDPAEFAEQMRSRGCTVYEALPVKWGSSDEDALCWAAKQAEQILYYFVFPSEEDAAACFTSVKDQLSADETQIREARSMDLGSRQRYTCLCRGEYTILSRSGDRVLACGAPEAERQALQDLAETLGY